MHCKVRNITCRAVLQYAHVMKPRLRAWRQTHESYQSGAVRVGTRKRHRFPKDSSIQRTKAEKGCFVSDFLISLRYPGKSNGHVGPELETSKSRPNSKALIAVGFACTRWRGFAAAVVKHGERHDHPDGRKRCAGPRIGVKREGCVGQISLLTKSG